MRDILRLLLGDGDGEGMRAEPGAGGWDQPSRRPSVADSRDWCGSEPGGVPSVKRSNRSRGRSRRGHRGPQRGMVRRGRRAGRSVSENLEKFAWPARAG